MYNICYVLVKLFIFLFTWINYKELERGDCYPSKQKTSKQLLLCLTCQKSS